MRRSLSEIALIVPIHVNSRPRGFVAASLTIINDQLLVLLLRLPAGYIKGMKVKTITVSVSDGEFLLISSDSAKSFDFDKIEYLWKRPPNVIEVFLNSGKSLLLDFAPQSIDIILAHFPPAKLAKLKPEFSLEQVMQDFATKPTSNFEHLMKVNLTCGRSFHSPRSYPLFPSFLVRFDDISNLRDFTRVGDIPTPESDRIGSDFTCRCRSLLCDALVGSAAVPPEFFYFAEIVRGRYELPKWADNGFDFVYKHRKLLERPVISQFLPVWIQNVFPVENHPMKFRRTSFCVQPSFELALDKKHIEAAFCSESEDSLNYIFVLGHRVIQFHSISFPHQQEATLVAQCRLKSHSRLWYFGMESKLVAYDSLTFQTITIDRESILYESHFVETALAANLGDQLILCPSTSSIAFDYQVVFHSKWRISAITANKVFHIVVFGTIDGNAVAVSLNKWQVVRRMSLGNGVAQHILVTDAFGLILVMTIERIFVFNVNGMPLKSVANRYDIVRWNKFVSSQGFDYVIYSTAGNDVGWFEAYYPDQNHLLFKCEKIVSLAYVRSIEMVVAVSAQGKVECRRLSPEV
jgi:hypothetical protein